MIVLNFAVGMNRTCFGEEPFGRSRTEGGQNCNFHIRGGVDMTRFRNSLWLAVLGIAALAVAGGAVAPFIRSARTVHPKTSKHILAPGADGESTLLFNGWRISPSGRHIVTGDMLL